MTTPRDKVMLLVETGKVSAEQGERLLAALTDESTKTSSWKLLVDPFARLSTKSGLFVVAFALLAQLVGSRLGMRYDGPLDVHIRVPATWTITLAELFVDFGVTAVVAWVIARALRTPARLVDVFVAIGIARVPLIIVSFLYLWLLPDLKTLEAISQAGSMPWHYRAVMMLSIPSAAWNLVLWFVGYRTATGLPKPKLWAAFLLTLVVAGLIGELML